MPATRDAAAQTPDKTQRAATTATSMNGVSPIGIGKRTLIGSAVSPRTTAGVDHDDFSRLFRHDENGKVIVQFARLYALDIATQIIDHYGETPRDFQTQFDVATESIAIVDIKGLPSASDEWKSKYGRHKIRIRVVGTFIELAKPPGFLVTMFIEGAFGTETFQPVLHEIVGAVPLRIPREPSAVPPENQSPPSVAPESADHAG